jgi:four helix bundle protein
MSSNFVDLKCWQLCNDLKAYLRENILQLFPKTERFELYLQLKRASRSATANIAEGWGRYHYKDNIKFLIIDRGSIAEVLDHILEAKSCEYISVEQVNEVRNKTNDSNKVINGYIRYLRNKDNDEDS